MNTNKPTIQEFKEQIETTFGKPLNQQSTEAAEDFWEHWDSFSSHISNGRFNILVDQLFLGYNFPEHKRYHPYKGAGKILFLLGIGFMFFIWKIGLALIISGILVHLYGHHIKLKDGQLYYDEMMADIVISPNDRGYAKLCAHYICGIIKFVTSNGTAAWPQHPSNSVTGNTSNIEHANKV